MGTESQSPDGGLFAAPLESGLDAQCIAARDRAEYVRIQQHYFERYRPLTPVERFYVDTLVRDEWMLRQMYRSYKNARAALKNLQGARQPEENTAQTPKLGSFLKNIYREPSRRRAPHAPVPRKAGI